MDKIKERKSHSKYERETKKRIPLEKEEKMRLPGQTMYRVDPIAKGTSFRLIRIWSNGDEEMMCQHPGSMIGCIEQAQQAMHEGRKRLNMPTSPPQSHFHQTQTKYIGQDTSPSRAVQESA